MQFALRDAFNQTQDWTSGIARLYYVLTQDFLYSDPEKLVIFADNHDLTRYFTSVGEDLNKWKMGMAFLLTTRGVPVIYYGTEILMTGDAGTGHGHIREDFPGGWLEDSINAFNELGRSPKQSEAFNYIQKLLQWRDQKEVIHSGKLKHFVPQDEVYSFFRYNDKDCVMVILNNSDQDKTVDMGRFNESTNSYMTGTEVMTGKVFDIKSPLKISPKSALILELGR